jgi:CRISPR-associated endonuclease Csn1
VESLKKVDGKRIDDARHHALDALAVAAIGEWEVQRLTRSYQEWEQQASLGRYGRLIRPGVTPLASDVKCSRLTAMSLSPGLSAGVRGEGHAATIRQVKERDGAPVVS